MGSNLIMQRLTGATFQITAALGLIKSQPTAELHHLHVCECMSLDDWLHCVLLLLPRIASSQLNK